MKFFFLPVLKNHFSTISTLLFIPYAQPGGISYDNYTNTVRKAFSSIAIDVKGIHEFENPIEAVEKAVGGQIALADRADR